MTDDDLAHRAEQLDEPSGRDDALVPAMAIVNSIPIVGSFVGTYISEYVPRQKQQRLIGFVQDLAREFEAEQDRVDRDFVRTDEFHRLFEDAVDRVQTVRNEGKHGYWASLIAGSARHDRPDERDRERMIEALDQLRKPHLRLLHVIATTREPRPGLYMGGVSDTLSWKMPDVPNEAARQDWADLARYGLTGTYPTGTMTAQGAGNLAGHLTPLGRRFVALLNLEAGYAE